MDTNKLKKIINIDWKNRQYQGVIEKAIETQFDLAVEAGVIPAHIENCGLTVSKKWLSSQSNLSNFYTQDFWSQISEISEGKKISLDYETHINKYFSSLEDLINEEIEGVEDKDIFLALLDLDKVNKHFTKKSVETLHVHFDKEVWGDYDYISFNEDLKSNIESQIADKVEMPDGFSKWVAKTQGIDLGLNTPSDKMALIIWKKKMCDIKITKKIFIEVIESLSNNNEINQEQWDIILEKTGTPKWLLSVMERSWNTRISYGKDRIREMDNNGGFSAPTKANFISLSPGS